jgi:hypothetical protein
VRSVSHKVGEALNGTMNADARVKATFDHH